MPKLILALLAMMTLASCSSMKVDHFSAMSHDSSEIPRVFAWVVDDELGVQMRIDHRIFGVQVGVPYDSGGGLIGAVTVSAMVAAEEEDALDLMKPIQISLGNYDFEGNFRALLRDKLLQPGLLPDSNVSYVASPNQYTQWDSGTVSIAAYQRFTQDLSALWTGISVYRFDRTDQGQAVHRSAYLYAFKLPESINQRTDAVLHAEIWNNNPALLDHLLKQGMSAAFDLMVSDLAGEIDIEGAEKVEMDPAHLFGHLPQAYLVSQTDDRIVIANQARSLVASMPTSAIKGNESLQAQKTLSQVKLAEGIDDTGFQANRKITVASNSSNAAPSADVIQFMGQAEEEITNKTYDRNLWAQALVLAEGDQTKRVAKYIELRARQLAGLAPTEAVATTPQVKPADQAEAGLDVSGTYRSDITTKVSYWFKTRKERRMKVVLEQDGNKITGHAPSTNSEITGTIEGDTINFTFWSSGPTIGSTIKGTWKINEDGSLMQGAWGYGGGSSGGTWDLVKTR